MGNPDPVRMTYADYSQLPEDGQRLELFEGDPMMMSPSASRRHQRISGRLFARLFAHIEEQALGEVYAAPLDVVLSDDTVVQPDLLFISRARRSALDGPYIHGAPDLVVEILSPTSRARDGVLKRRLYARFGVREYWLVDPEERTITVLTLRGHAYRKLASSAGDAPVRSLLLPELALTPADVFAE